MAGFVYTCTKACSGCGGTHTGNSNVSQANADQGAQNQVNSCTTAAATRRRNEQQSD